MHPAMRAPIHGESPRPMSLSLTTIPKEAGPSPTAASANMAQSITPSARTILKPGSQKSAPHTAKHGSPSVNIATHIFVRRPILPQHLPTTRHTRFYRAMRGRVRNIDRERNVTLADPEFQQLLNSLRSFLARSSPSTITPQSYSTLSPRPSCARVFPDMMQSIATTKIRYATTKYLATENMSVLSVTI